MKYGCYLLIIKKKKCPNFEFRKIGKSKVSLIVREMLEKKYVNAKLIGLVKVVLFDGFKF